MEVPSYLPYLLLIQVTVGFLLFLIASCRILWTFLVHSKCLKRPVGFAPSFVVYLTCIFLECLVGSVYYGYLGVAWKYEFSYNAHKMLILGMLYSSAIPSIPASSFFLTLSRCFIVRFQNTSQRFYERVFSSLSIITGLVFAFINSYILLFRFPSDSATDCWSFICLTGVEYSFFFLATKMVFGFLNIVFGLVFFYCLRSSAKNLAGIRSGTESFNERRRINRLVLYVVFTDLIFNFIPILIDLCIRPFVEIASLYVGHYITFLGACHVFFISFIYSRTMEKSKNSSSTGPMP